MILNAALEIAAFPFLLVLAVYLHIKYTPGTVASLRFRALVDVTLFVIIADVLARFLMQKEGVPHIAVNAALALYYILATVSPYHSMRYAIGVMQKEYPRLHVFHLLLLCVYGIFHTLNVFFEFVRVQGTPDVPVQGVVYALTTFGVPAYFMILASVFMLLPGSESKGPQRMILCIGNFLVMVTGLLQTLFFVEHRVIFMVQPMALFGLFFSIEVPMYREIEQTIARLSTAQKEAVTSREKAVAASRAKSDFLANTSHEVRTPMNAILGMNEMILQESTDEETLRASHDIREAGGALLQIINDILDISRLESGRMELVAAPYALSEVLSEAKQSVTDRMEDDRIRFVTAYDETLRDGRIGDAARVGQVLYNLLDNAVKYTEEGQICLRVKASEDPDEVLFEIEDTGVGIRAEDMERLFAGFERADSSANYAIRGVGLGLTLAHAFIKMMDGDIHAESRIGAGTKFSFCLRQPVDEDETETLGQGLQRLSDAVTERTAQDTIDLTGVRALVIDDTNVNLIVARGFMRQTNAQVDTASRGEEGLEKAARTKYDILFIDHNMPGMDGVETLHAFRELKDNASKDAVTVALTANTGAGQREAYRREGFDDYLAKPLDHKELMRLLHTYFKQ